MMSFLRKTFLRKTFSLLLVVSMLLFMLPGMLIAEDFLSDPGKMRIETEAPGGAEGTEGTEGPEGPGKQESGKESPGAGMIGALGAFAKLAGSGDCQIIDVDGETILETYDNFADALAAVESGQTIKLLKGINYNGGIVITGKSIIFDVNGFILNVGNDFGHALEVGAGGEVRLAGSGIGGMFNVYAGDSGFNHGVYAHSGGKAEVTDATKIWTGTGALGAGYGVNAIGVGTEVTVYGDVPGGDSYGLGASEGATVTVYGNIDGGPGASDGVPLNVGGGMLVSGVGTTVTVHGYTGGYPAAVFATDGANVYIRSHVHGDVLGVWADSGAKVTIDRYIKNIPANYFLYVQLGGLTGVIKMQEDYEQDAGGLPVSQKDGYFEYNDGTSYVWVKSFFPGLGLYTVTYDPGEQGEFEAKMYYGLKKDMATPAAPATPGKKGWTFTEWDPEVSATVTKNITYTAQWTKNAPTYTVAYKPGEHGTFPLETHCCLKAGETTPEAPKATGEEGWAFAGWSPVVSAIVIEDIYYVAQWVEDNGGGTGNPGGGAGGGSEVDLGGEPTTDPSDPPATPSVTPPSEEKPDGSSPVVTPVNPPIYTDDTSPDYSFAPEDPPTPNRPGHQLIPNGLMSFTEINDEGVPVGVWTWNEEAQEWIFDSILLHGGLPKTNDARFIKEALFLLSLLILIIVLKRQQRAKKFLS